jgi:murein DD-endopeptidase MepM/ murein hydrolase activator NlpD
MVKVSKKHLLIGFLTLNFGGFLVPEGQCKIPVVGAPSKDWNYKAFWYYPWGRSGVHKGIDIFAKEGTPVFAAKKLLGCLCRQCRNGQ